MLPKISALILVLTMAAAIAGAARADAQAARQQFDVTSEALDETRTLYVQRPSPAALDPAAAPVFIILDGEYLFEPIAGYYRYYSRVGNFPQAFIVGVENVNRNRDFIRQAENGYPHTGGGAAFQRFLNEELIAWLERELGATGPKILIGHSFGGTATLDSAATAPGVFDAYIALSSSVWMNDYYLTKAFETASASGGAEKAFLYMSVGSDDGGPTVPSGEALKAVIEQAAPAHLEWYFDIVPAADHFANVFGGLNRALTHLFPRSGLDDELRAVAAEGDPAQIDAWFADKQAALGFRFVPAWFDLSMVAMQSAGAQQYDVAKAIERHLVQRHPTNPYVYYYDAVIHEQAGDLEEAQALYQRCLDVTRDTGADPNWFTAQYAINGLERVDKALEER